MKCTMSALMLVGILLGACAAPVAEAPATEEQHAATAAQEDLYTLVVGHQPGDNQLGFVEQLVEDFEANNPNVNVCKFRLSSRRDSGLRISTFSRH